MKDMSFEEIIQSLNSIIDEGFKKILKEFEHYENIDPTVDEYLAYQ